jgi:hypothetical protein
MLKSLVPFPSFSHLHLDLKAEVDDASKAYFLKLRSKQFQILKQNNLKLSQQKLVNEHKQIIELVKRNYSKI